MSRIKNERFFLTIKEYMETELPNSGCKSAKTLESYRKGINQYLDFVRVAAGKPLSDVGFSDINAKNLTSFRQHLEDAGLSPSTVRLRMTAVRAFVKYALKMEEIDPTAAMGILAVNMPRRPRKLVTPLSDAALECILKQPDTTTKNGFRDMTMLVFLYDTAARCDEILSVRICDLNLEERIEHVYLLGKGRKTRVMPLELSAEHIRKYIAAFHPGEPRDSSAPLFYPQGASKRKMNISSLEKIVTKYADRARKECPEVPEKVHPHLFRHTRAMAWRAAGMPLESIAELLGHENLDTARIYAKSDVSMKRKNLETYRKKVEIVGSTDVFWANDDDMIRRLYGLA